MNNMHLSEFKDVVNRGGKETKEYISQQNECCDNVLLFFSYDIVNSSIYKTVNYYGWSFVIDHILERIRELINAKIKGAELWRIAGDEEVFVITIFEKDSLFEYVDRIYEVLTLCCEDIANGKMFDNISSLSNEATCLMKLQNVISLKACCWLAPVTNKQEVDNKTNHNSVDNIYERIEKANNNTFLEFIGIDIDTGFRLAKQTRARRLVVSFELAYLLKERSEYNNRLHIITYRKLKGVWNNKDYPIIWYYDSSKHNGVSFDDSFPFDAVKQDKLCAEYFGKKQYDGKMYTQTFDALKKICSDRQLEQKIERIENLIDAQTRNHIPYLVTPRMELHCVAVCFNQGGEIFVVKRSKNKDYLPGKWEFGCAKANYTDPLKETIEEDYKTDFNLSISLVCDNNRKDRQPIPLAVYSVEKQGQLHKGLIFLAQIKDGEDIRLNSRKHADYKFINKADLDSLNEEEFVSDAIDTLKKAFEMWGKLYNNSQF